MVGIALLLWAISAKPSRAPHRRRLVFGGVERQVCNAALQIVERLAKALGVKVSTLIE